MDKHVSEWVGKCINDMTPPQADAAKANILRIDDRLSIIYQGCSERAVKALFLVNSGGVISILTYIFQDRKLIHNPDIKFSLLTFLFGLAFVFLGVVGVDYFLSFYRSQSFGRQVKKFIGNEIAFFDIHQFNKPGLRWFDLLVLAFGILSGGCAIGGILFGLKAYLC